MPMMRTFAATAHAAVGAAALLMAPASGAQDVPLDGPRFEEMHPETVTKIAMGSCHKRDRFNGIWKAIGADEPDIFLFLGDNIYGDTEDMSVMRERYEMLESYADFAEFRERVPVFATWDDHDFGVNDGGAEYPEREGSQEEFFRFVGEPMGSWRRDTSGVYDVEYFGPPERRVQVILLDTRWFRGPLATAPNDGSRAEGVGGRYVPNRDPSVTMLGEEQWAWLERTLRVPAELRVIASSIQVVAEDHRYEKWANLPHERSRLMRTIAETGAEGVVFVSGDRHSAELSVLDPARCEPGTGGDWAQAVGYPLFDFTVSALTNSYGGYSNELNRHRVGSQFHDNNFGTIEIDWECDDPSVVFELHDAEGVVVFRYETTVGGLGR
ncbi:MAG: alkaline phosphatase D family protein [Planctomycetota bacterium]